MPNRYDGHGGADDDWPMFRTSSSDGWSRQSVAGSALSPRMSEQRTTRTPNLIDWGEDDYPVTSGLGSSSSSRSPRLGITADNFGGSSLLSLPASSALDRLALPAPAPLSPGNDYTTTSGRASKHTRWDDGIGGGAPDTDGWEDGWDRGWNDGAGSAYEVLGISDTSSQREIKAAYKEAAMRYHPDRVSTRTKDPQRIQDATERFKKIGEAFALLGDPDRRAEYDQLLRNRRRYNEGRSNKPPDAPSFKSSFVPRDVPPASPRDAPRSTSAPRVASACSFGRGDDLRNLDAFDLFSRMFPDAFSGSAGSASVEGSRSGARTRRNDQWPSRDRQRPSQPSSIDEAMSNILGNPFYLGGDGLTSDGCSRSKPLNLRENHSKVHMNRHGRLNVEHGEKSLRVSKGGSITFESHSFSGSFGKGMLDNGSTLSSVFGSRSLGMGQGMTGMGMSMLGGPGMGWGEGSGLDSDAWTGGRDQLGLINRLPRRQSVGELASGAARSEMAISGALQRRPSISFEEAYGSPAMNDLSMIPQRRGGAGGHADGWNTGW